MVVYADVELLHFVCDALFDYLLVWASASVIGRSTPWYRLALAATVGAVQYVGLRLSELELIGGYGFWHSAFALVLCSLAMLAVAFYPLRWRRFASATITFYALAFAAGGTGMAAGLYLGRPVGFNVLAATIVACCVILLVAEFGWGAVQRSLERRSYQVPVRLVFGNDRITLNALIDTGNQLRDPLSSEPVAIVEAAALRGAFGGEFDEILQGVERAPADFGPLLTQVRLGRWSRRLRVIPYSAVGKSAGLMVGFRADSVEVAADGKLLPTSGAIVGISPGPLDMRGQYQALVPPELVHTARAIAAEAPAQKRTPAEISSAS